MVQDMFDFDSAPLFEKLKITPIKTNGDKIRSSTDEEIAEMLAKKTAYLPETILKWRKQEVDDGSTK